jgi:2-dehydro-3-deoxyphosphogluconate aldolase / (4S)-4-hydroxy-2-oxoglutarate aldolase
VTNLKNSGSAENDTWEGLLAGIRVIPVVVVDESACAGPLAETLRSGGLPIAEVTLRTPAAMKVLEVLAQTPSLLAGAGTVTNVHDVDRAADVGARFVVSPGLSEAVAERAALRGLPYLPGISTATEVMRALDLGLTTLKLFPADVAGGRRLVRALASPFPGVRFVPTGGVTASSAVDYLDEPAVLAVGGSWMVPRRLLAQGSFDEVRELVKDAAKLGVQNG